jgi:hypothetical protein
MVTKYETLLAIDGVTLPIASARGIKQRLEPIQQGGNFRRTVNMALRNTAPVEAKFKYRTSITCDDINAPMWDGLFLGKQVVIDCVEELFYLTSGGSPLKTVVPGSTRVVGTVTFYRPRITMLITSFGSDGEEYEAARGWSIEAEEV